MASINGKERIHCCHTFRRWSWISSCHSTVSFQSSCINTLIGRTYGDRNPRGSNSKLMVERILRLVAGLSVGTVLRQKTSLSASQCRPNVDWSAVCLVRGWGLGWPYLVMAVPAELLFDCSSIALRLLKNLVRWKPPSFSIAVSLTARSAASSTVEVDLRRSST